VCCGQLLDEKAGVFMLGLHEEADLPMAAGAGVLRMTETGAAVSMWIVTVGEPLRGEVMSTLAALSAAEGCA
jgi:hypothetical protein